MSKFVMHENQDAEYEIWLDGVHEANFNVRECAGFKPYVGMDLVLLSFKPPTTRNVRVTKVIEGEPGRLDVEHEAT